MFLFHADAKPGRCTGFREGKPALTSIKSAWIGGAFHVSPGLGVGVLAQTRRGHAQFRQDPGEPVTPAS